MQYESVVDLSREAKLIKIDNHLGPRSKRFWYPAAMEWNKGLNDDKMHDDK